MMTDPTTGATIAPFTGSQEDYEGSVLHYLQESRDLLQNVKDNQTTIIGNQKDYSSSFTTIDTDLQGTNQLLQSIIDGNTSSTTSTSTSSETTLQKLDSIEQDIHQFSDTFTISLEVIGALLIFKILYGIIKPFFR